MPKVSSNKVQSKLHDKLFSLLPDMLAGCRNTSSAFVVTNTLFSSVERTMIAKRLAIMLMLFKGYNYAEIGSKLKVSQGTIAKMSETLSHADPRFLAYFDKIASRDAAKDFFNELGYTLDKLMSPQGRSWSNWRSNLERSHREGKQPF